MSDPLSRDPTTAAKKASNVADRRASERVSLSAIAELVDLGTKQHRTARVADISLHGCYVDAISVYPVGARVRISILHSEVQLDAFGVVTYSLPGMGMGVNFTDLPPEMESVIDHWISEIKGASAQDLDHSDVDLSMQSLPRAERLILGRLISLLVRKGVLTREEGSDLLSALHQE